MAEEYQMEENESTELPEKDPGEDLVGVTDPMMEDYVEEDPAPEEAPTEEEAPSTEEVFRDEQYVWGQQIGLTREQVENFGSPEAFDNVVSRLAASANDSGEEEVREEASPAEPLSSFVLQDAEDYDDGIVQFVEHTNGQLERLAGEVEGLRSENSRLLSSEYARQSEANVAEFERIVNTMDEATFGRGEQDSLPSHEADTRMRLAQAVSRLGHGYEARGEEIPSMTQLVEEAAGAVFGNDIKNRTLRNAAQKTREQRSQTSAVPTHEEASPLTSEEAAVKAATEWQQDKGWR